MAAVEKYIVRRDDGLVLLFTPPFDKGAIDPGYIKGYPPGIRENGGQYTHAALWSVLAYAMLGNGDKAHDLLTMLNPIRHAGNSAAIHRYKVEPYAVCADVYGAPPHVGRGGWTWYTGSAGWMYRLVLEGLLGIHLQGDQLRLSPRMPKRCTTFPIHYRYRQTHYHITVTRFADDSSRSSQIILDGQELSGETIPLVDDHRDHSVEFKTS